MIYPALTVVTEKGVARAEWKKSKSWKFVVIAKGEKAVDNFERRAVATDRNKSAVSLAPGVARNFGGVVGNRCFT